MLVRDPSDRTPFFTEHSELFEQAFFAIEVTHPPIGEAYDQLDWIMARDPLGNSSPFVVGWDPGRQFRLALTPRTVRYPSLRVLLEIDAGRRRVYFWHLSLR